MTELRRAAQQQNSWYHGCNGVLLCLFAVDRLEVHELRAVSQALRLCALCHTRHVRPQVGFGTPPVLHLQQSRPASKANVIAAYDMSMQWEGIR